MLVVCTLSRSWLERSWSQTTQALNQLPLNHFLQEVQATTSPVQATKLRQATDHQQMVIIIIRHLSFHHDGETNSCSPFRSQNSSSRLHHQQPLAPTLSLQTPKTVNQASTLFQHQRETMKKTQNHIYLRL